MVCILLNGCSSLILVVGTILLPSSVPSLQKILTEKFYMAETKEPKVVTGDDKETVVAQMRETLLRLVPTLGEKKNPIKPEEYFSGKWIAPCFWTPRKEEFGGKPWLDDALFIFAQNRKFDFTSGAKRFFKFNQAAFATGVVSLDEIPRDVMAILGPLAAYYMSPTLDGQGRPVVYLSCNYFGWDHMTTKGAQRAHIWLFWQWATMWGDLSNTRGISFIMCFKGMSMSQCKTDFETWMNKMFTECLPTKISAMYMCYEPFWFGNLMWPWVAMSLKKKVKDRVVWLGDKPEKVGARYLLSAFKLTQGEADPKDLRAEIPVELGGTYSINPETCDAYFRGKWKISEEAIPDGCFPPPKKK